MSKSRQRWVSRDGYLNRLEWLRKRDPLKLSNPFLKDSKKKAFNEFVNTLSTQFPDAKLDWVRKQAWARARQVA